MSWNPKFNFSLRDDEVTLCDLIFDKQCAELLCKELLRIKNGTSTSIEMLKQILSMGCFTDEELSNTKYELDIIKNDINVFSGMLRASQRFSSWWDSTAVKVSYIAGSETWFRHYIELKSMAADMYMRLLSEGHMFEASEKAEYDRRYADVIQSTTSKERTELAIRRQYEKNLADGDEHAQEKYFEAMVTAGLMTEEQVNAQSILLRAANSAGSESDLKPLEEGEVRVSYDIMYNLWLDLNTNNNNDIETIVEVSKTLLAAFSSVLEKAGLTSYVRSLNSYNALMKYDKDAYIASIYEWFGLLKNAEVTSALLKADIRWQQDYINNLKQQIEAVPVTSAKNETVITVDLIEKVYNDITNITDHMQRAMKEVRFVEEVIKILKAADILTSSKWSEVCERFVTDGNVPAGEVHEQARGMMNAVTFSQNKVLIDSLDYTVTGNWEDLFKQHK